MNDEEKKYFVTEDAKMSSTEADQVTSGPYLKINSAQLFELAKLANETKKSFDEIIAPKMTFGRAQRIRTLRAECSWRQIAAITHKEWGDDAEWGEPISNQLAGVSLCEHAARMLGEDADKEPWN